MLKHLFSHTQNMHWLKAQLWMIWTLKIYFHNRCKIKWNVLFICLNLNLVSIYFVSNRVKSSTGKKELINDLGSDLPHNKGKVDGIGHGAL